MKLKTGILLLAFAVHPSLSLAACDPDAYLNGESETKNEQAFAQNIKTVQFARGVLDNKVRQSLLVERLKRGTLLAVKSLADESFSTYVSTPSSPRHYHHWIVQFRLIEPGKILVISTKRDPSDQDGYSLINQIARANLPTGGKTVSLMGGFLEGFDLHIDRFTLAKILQKHEVGIVDVVKAFVLWQSGKALPAAGRADDPDRERYVVVVDLGHRDYFEFIFDWNSRSYAPGGRFENQTPTVNLVSAYRTDMQRFAAFITGAQGIE